MSDPTVVESTMIHRVLRYAQKIGLDEADLLERVGLSATEVAVPERLYPLAQAALLHKVVAELSGDAALGLSLAEASQPRDYGLIGLLFSHAATVEEAFNILGRLYGQFLAGAYLRVTREGEQLRVVHGFLHDHPGIEHVRQDALAAFYIHGHRAHGGGPARRVAFEQRSAVPERFRDLFGVEVVFGADEDEMLLDGSSLRTDLPGADPLMLAHLLEAAETHLSRRRAAAGRETALLRLQGCIVDISGGVIRKASETLYLTSRERELLEYFAARRNEVVTHEDIERDVWHLGKTVVSHAPAVAIRRLRQKIEPPGPRPVNLVTVFGEGWKLVVGDD